MFSLMRSWLVSAILVLGLVPQARSGEYKDLIPLADLKPEKLTATDAKAELKGPAGDAFLQVQYGHEKPWPGIAIQPPQGHWDLSAFTELIVSVKLIKGEGIRFGCRLDSPATDKEAVYISDTRELIPGMSAVLHVPLRRQLPPALAGKLFGMRGNPGGFAEKGGIDVSQVNKLTLFTARPRQPSTVEVYAIRVGGSAEPLLTDPAKLFPMIDSFGQYVHKDWPGKVHNAAELVQRQAEEQADCKKNPGPKDWNIYGGWQAGPDLKGTGFFRTAKHEGRWWLVDPEGRLFWSHGIDCVRTGAETPITDRQHWFQDLPAKGTPLAQFFGSGRWAPHGYYQGKSYETYNFVGANLQRKYGSGWNEQFRNLAHQRLRSWGMNTIGNWSDAKLFAMHKTPYVATINAESRSLEGSTGYWGKFPDVFDTGFKEKLRKRMAQEKGGTAGDPWCLGYFVGNELSWGDDLSLALAALASPADQPAKRAFVDDLKKKYTTVEALNQAWGTHHASWDALFQSTATPDKKKAHDDLAAFATRTAEQYFRVCREAVKEAAPSNLYLGCRFAWVNDRAVRAATKYCDVVSFNLYRDSVAKFQLPAEVDMPVIIGEFHFGALDRGMFHPGLRLVANQQERAQAYERYVHGALSNPNMVGTHWFQYYDQAATGRGDGENYQIGFLDVCDTPYPETVSACREVGYSMYPYRAR